MPLIAQRIVRGLTPFIDPVLTPAARSRPEKIVLGVKPGHRPSDRPPVRIFLGTERQQFRAERVFLWSVERNRDPSRIYEIHLLKGLKGYVSGFWITGFTNYRFAIPYFCDYTGRAIYNDVDQVWLTDPAELFDREMDGAGFLSINDRDTSVMLIDCKRMAGVWNREAVVGTTRKRIEARARAAGTWGEMPGRFNARDAEFVPGESACVHFTTLHTQPWRPFPQWFVYHRNPTGSLWFDLEREADAAGFVPVSALRPSSAWPDTALLLTSRPDGPEIRAVLGADPDATPVAERRSLAGLLERVPDADLPWVLERLFARTRRLEIRVDEPVLIRPGRPRRSLHFWRQQLQLAERLHPGTRWRFERRVGPFRDVLAGGPLRDGTVAAVCRPNVRARSKVEAVAATLARKTGREMTRIGMPGNLFAASLRALTGRGLLNPGDPPAVLVASGSLATRAARRAARRCPHPPALVLLGRHAGPVPEHGGVAISMVHHRLPPHPRRITTLLGFGHRDEWRPAVEPDAWKSWLEARRRCALLVGRHPGGRWSAQACRTLVEQALEWATRRNARLLIVTTADSRAAAPLIEDHAGARADVYAWRADEKANPYGLALQQAHALLVAGGSPSVLQDALASPRPVYLVPHRARTGVLRRIAGRIAERAFRPSYNKRGSIRPQQGLTYLCARLVERGWVMPPTGLADWQRALVERGLAAWIGAEAIPSARHEPELESVCDRAMALLEPGRSESAANRPALPRSG